MIRAVIFDLDGTLVETEELKALSYARAAVELRPELNEAEVVEAFKDVVGLSRQEVAMALLQRFGLEAAARARMAEFGVSAPWHPMYRCGNPFTRRCSKTQSCYESSSGRTTSPCYTSSGVWVIQ